MNYTITQSTAFPLVEVTLHKDEQIRIERGSMVYHNGEVSLEGKMNSSGGGVGGFMKALGRSMVSGESMFITTVTGLSDNAKIGIAPGSPGAIKEIQLGQEHWRISDHSFFACDAAVSYEMKKQSLGKAFFGRTGGLFVMETKGDGSMLVTAYGDLMEFNLDGTKPFIFDNEHVVAWSNTLDYEIKVASGTFGFLSGEGLVNEFHGAGKVLIQTRNISSLADMLKPYLPSGN
ncbi:TIGR00266 family protein [Christensenellaceae bacterium OttesenSCG-928-K19]|nr:TIGR00266 family protein [Christensenellaceae bacterium OttesenSCG-928-K19]